MSNLIENSLKCMICILPCYVLWYILIGDLSWKGIAIIFFSSICGEIYAYWSRKDR